MGWNEGFKSSYRSNVQIVQAVARSAMDGQVCLLVAGKIERVDAHFALDGNFEDTGADQFSLVKNFPRQADVDRDDFYECSFRCYLEAPRCEIFSVSCSA